MDEPGLQPNLAQVPEDTEQRQTLELSAQATMMALRIRARYPDNYVLRDELAKLCDIVAKLSLQVEASRR